MDNGTEVAGGVALYNSQARPAPLTPMEMLGAALERGADLTVLEKLMDLQERHEKSEARKAFDAAMASASAEFPTIKKTREVDFTSAKGRTHYKHEDLATIGDAVKPVLSKHGLSYRFRTSAEPNAPVIVTCIVSHRLGYFEENTLCAGRDDSGNKNAIQAIGSTLTYLQRMTLKAALGLAAAADDDARASGGGDAAITAEQLAALQKLASDGAADLEKFCAYFKIDALPDLRASQFENAKAALFAKAKAKKVERMVAP